MDAEGRLLGINSIRLEGGLILAVPPPPLVRDRLLGLAGGETAAPPRLGVAVAPPRVARRMRRAVGLPERAGLLVRAVEEDSPADHAGLQRATSWPRRPAASWTGSTASTRPWTPSTAKGR